MKASLPPALSTITRQTLIILGKMIKSARLERKLSQEDLAQRLNKSRYTIISIEKGNPDVAIGAVFEAAVIVGIPLLEEDKVSFQRLSNIVSNLAYVLPKRARKPTIVDDDF